jgi:drug/metabolite transporter (DMT)-like permease
VPILAETTAIIAGTSPIRWRWAAAAGAAGNVAPAALYAASGAVVTSLTSQAVVFGVVLAIAAGFWLLGRRARPSATITTSDADGALEPRRAVT